MDDVYGCEKAVREYITYSSAVEEVIQFLKEQGHSPKRLEIDLFSCLYGGTWLVDDAFEKEKKKKDFPKKAGYWYLKYLEQQWNQVAGYPENAVSGLIRVDTFFEEHLYKFPAPFEFVAKSRFSQSAARFARKLAVRPSNRVCTCGNGICPSCYGDADAEPCILQGNRITGIKPGGERSLTFCSFVCRKNSPCSCPLEDGSHQRFPKRDFPILVSFQPKVKGMGLSAICPIPQWTVISEYVGEVVTVTEAQKIRNYQMAVPGVPLVIDALDIGNEARFANHSCGPNAGVLLCHEGSGKALPRLYYVSLRDIKTGEEVVVDYHPSHAFKRKRRPLNASDCKCGHEKCRSYV